MQQIQAQFVDKCANQANIVLNLRVLGSYEVNLGEQPVTNLGSRKAYALLFYLAVVRKPVARSTLTTLLWPDMPANAAKNNLRTTLTTVKKALGSYLEITRESVTFVRTSRYELDVETLSARLDSGMAKQDVPELQRAVQIYHDEFLHGFYVKEAEPFEEWLLQQREQLHLRIVHALETLLALCLKRESYVAGVAAGRRLLELEPWSEFAHRHLMMLLTKSGQRASALAQYERCREVVADALGMEPMPETTALYEQIRSGEYGANVITDDSSVIMATALPRADQQLDLNVESSLSIPHNVPTALTRLIGYAKPLAYIQQHLHEKGCRLLTLTGLGGVGKTHLALAAAGQLVKECRDANRFCDGVYFVPLDGVRKEASSEEAGRAIALAIAEVLGYSFGGKGSAQEQLQSHLTTKQMLLILDGMEHLTVGALFIATLLQEANQLTILVTSRERLKLRGEQVLELPGLLPETYQAQNAKAAMHNGSVDGSAFHEAPASMGGPLPVVEGRPTWQTNDATALFLYHAQTVQHHFVANGETMAHIEQICELVDGLPLGIAMAAKWLEIMDCAAIVDEISRNLDFLETTQRNVPRRHQTLRAVFNHSWASLTAAQQSLLAHLSIFQPSFPTEAAMAVTGASLPDLASLVNKSLLGRNAHDQLTMHRSIRHFAHEQLHRNQQEMQSVEVRYATYYLDLAKQHWQHFTSPQWIEAGAPLVNDIHNVKAALRLAVEHNMWDADIQHGLPL